MYEENLPFAISGMLADRGETRRLTRNRARRVLPFLAFFVHLMDSLPADAKTPGREEKRREAEQLMEEFMKIATGELD